MTRTFLLAIVAIAPAALVAGSAEPSPALDPARPYTARKSAPVDYEIDFRVIVTAPAGTKTLKVWVPVPRDDAGQKVTDGTWSVFPADVKPAFHTEKVFGNRFAYLEFASPQGAQIIAHSFQATVWQLDWDVNLNKVERIDSWPASFNPFRRSESGIRIDDMVKDLAGKLTGKDEPRSDLAAIMGWVHANMSYDHSTTSLIASSEHALAKKRGDCSDYHGLCSSLGRALGIPTRITYGLHLFPKNLPVHCKLEAYLQPHGWVSFDVSETQRLVRSIEAAGELREADRKALVAAALARLNRGFRDNTWLLATRGTDFELAPPASGTVPLISTIYAEADGKPLPLPDPADPKKREFAWMTAHKYAASRAVSYPFRDWETLRGK